MALRISRLQACLAIALIVSMVGVSTPAHARSGGRRRSRSSVATCKGRSATIVDGPGSHSINGTAERDVIVAGSGDDTIHSRGGDDFVCGGPGNDRASGGVGHDALFGEEGDDVLRGNRGHDGGFDGGRGDDKLFGEKGGRNDLVPGPGDDLVVGSGTGEDWVHMEDALGPVHANLTSGVATGQGTDELVDVSGVLSGIYDDTLIGSDGTNQLVGEDGADTLVGRAGNDTLSGEQDDDVYRGGTGFDVAEYFDQAAAAGLAIGPMNVNLRTGIATGDGTDTLSGIEGATGSDKADTMVGDAKGNYFAWLFGGNDTVKAGGGDDYVQPGSGANDVSGGSGRDLLDFRFGTDFDHPHPAVTADLSAGTSSFGDTISGFEDVFGSFYDDTLIGDGGTNRLFGLTGDDVLVGRAGNDLLFGGTGRPDKANGGVGKDRCRADVTKNCEVVSRVDGVPSPIPGLARRLHRQLRRVGARKSGL